MIRIYTEIEQGKEWIERYRSCLPLFGCVLGFTETGLIPGISAAGLTSEDRKYTAIADAEFLYYGAEHRSQYPLPPLTAGASPVFISRAVVEALHIPVYLFNSGLPYPPNVPAIDLGGSTARCLSTGNALELATVQHLLEVGLLWGDRLAAKVKEGYIVLGECVVGGTTTALAILLGLGIDAAGKVNSSHPTCNHTQKLTVVQAGLKKMKQTRGNEENVGSNVETPFIASGNVGSNVETPFIASGSEGRQQRKMAPMSPMSPMSPVSPVSQIDPLELVAAVGDPMQISLAGMAIALSRSCGVLLAGGTQMLAVYALMRAIATTYALPWRSQQVVVGTTRWVAEDPTGSTVELAQLINLSGCPVSLLATQLNFTNSRYPQLQAYEQGFVKEGMGAGGAAIAAHLYQNWQQNQLLAVIETQIERMLSINSD
ncbi:nicotinate-nucleotide--dimethylbenzimidazole phosphoribosyltransferase [Mastigocladus laminosus UU774]|nr:nicotinate-nucleotide--dimethylbenzimidazole phosphoribosyltransferase [Mastigocladus laminosus UU774]